MSARRVIYSTLAAAGLLAPAAAPVGPARATSSAKQHAATVLVTGDVKRPVRLSFARLAALPQKTLEINYQTPAGTTRHTERGPLLANVIALAGPRFRSTIQNDQLRFYVEANAVDGYGALVAFDEVSPLFGSPSIILSLNEDGRSLKSVGPRLIVPRDAGGQRNVKYVDRLVVGHG